MNRTTIIAVFAILSACSPKHTTTPATAAAPTAAGVQPLAVVPIHVTYVLRSLVPALDSAFPARDSLDRSACQNAAGLICHRYVYQRDPLTLSANGTRFVIDTRLKYRAQVGLPGARIASCGYAPEEMRRASLNLATSLYWRKDWRIGSRDTKLAATLDDQCRVTALSIDATPALRNIIDNQLAAFAAQVDSAVPIAADLKPLADSLWKSFSEPTALDSTNTLWLLLEPEALRVAPLLGLGTVIKTAITIYARPRVIAGARPSYRLRPLPELSMYEAPLGFQVPVTIELPFAELDRRATALLVAETARSSVRIDSAHITGQGDSVRVELNVSGGLKGTLALISRMRWDAAARELRLDDLDWTLESRSALSRVKASLAAPLIGRAVRRATMGGRVSLGAQLDSTRAELVRKLREPVGPGIIMGGDVSDVRITSVFATSRAFVVNALLTGQAGVMIQ